MSFLRGLILLLMLCGPALSAEPPVLRVSAAISLKDALESIAAAYEKETGQKVEFNFGGSGALAAQIERGADVDLFISAAGQQVNQLIERKVVDAASTTVVVTNELVLIVPAGGGSTVRSFDDLRRDAVQRIAAGESRAVPAGMYARQTLEHLKLADAVHDRLVFGGNVRQVLDYVIRGEVDAGLVYRTDALQAGEKVVVIADAPAGSHDPIEYPACIVSATTQRPAAERFLKYLAGEVAQEEFRKRGFGLPRPKVSIRHPVFGRARHESALWRQTDYGLSLARLRIEGTRASISRLSVTA